VTEELSRQMLLESAVRAGVTEAEVAHTIVVFHE
jgi:hypothetical protein